MQNTLVKFFLNIIITLSVLTLLTACEDPSPPEKASIRPVKTFKVKKAQASIHRTYPATVLASQEVELSFRVSGKLIKLNIKEAETIKKGDVIAQLDKRDFKAEIARLQSEKANAVAKLSSMKKGARQEDIASLNAAVAAAKEKLRAARDQVGRSQKLFEKGIVTISKLDEQKAQMSVAEADLKYRQQELIKGKAGARSEDIDAQEAIIEGLDTQIETAKNNLSDTTLLAPFDGIVASRRVDNFVNVQAKQPIVILQNIESVDMTFDVPGSDVPRFSNAKTLILQAEFDDIPGKKFSASFVEFSTQPDALTQTYRGRVAIAKPQNITVLSGMTGRVKITRHLSRKKSYFIPSSSIGSTPDGAPFIWKLDTPENKVSMAPVRIGEGKGAHIEILEGVKDGDVVISAGVSHLRKNMKVRPYQANGEK